jgi:hypothetical protein
MAAGNDKEPLDIPLSERLDRYRREAQRIVASGTEHPCWELTRQASFHKTNLEAKADFLKMVQGISNSHVGEERILVIGADQKNKCFVPVTNAEEYDPARVSAILAKHLSPSPVLEIFNSVATDEGIPFVLFIFAATQSRPIVAKGDIQDGKGFIPFRKGEIWIKDGTGLRTTTPEDLHRMIEGRIEAEADFRARRQFAQLRDEIIAAQQLLASGGRRTPTADLIYGLDETFRLYVQDLLANDDFPRFRMLVEVMRERLIDGWNRVDAYSSGAVSLFEIEAQISEHKHTQFLPALRRSIETGLLLIKHQANEEWFLQITRLLVEAFEDSSRLVRLEALEQTLRENRDFDSYLGSGMVGQEILLGARILATYAIKRRQNEFVSPLLKSVVKIIGEHNDRRKSLLLWPLRRGIPMPGGLISFCWEKRVSRSFLDFFGNADDFLRSACQLEFVLELNSFVGMGHGGTKAKDWLETFRPELIFNYFPDHLRYDLGLCQPIANEVYDALKRGPDDWLLVHFTVEKMPFDLILKPMAEDDRALFLAKYIRYLEKQQLGFFPQEFFRRSDQWGRKLTPLLVRFDSLQGRAEG